MNDVPSQSELSKKDREFLKKLADMRKAVTQQANQESQSLRPKLLALIIRRTFWRGLPPGWGK